MMNDSGSADMNLYIDFYSKDEVATLIEFDSQEKSSPQADLELVMFGWYVLRQFSNLGGHKVSDVLAGLLLSDQIKNLTNEYPKLPEAGSLLGAHYLVAIAERTNGKLDILEPLNPDTAIEYSNRLFNDPAIPLVNKHILSHLPRIVPHRSKGGSKSFRGKIPPGTLEMKGFGMLGTDVNYYVFHSVVAFARSLAMKHSNDEQYLRRLSYMAGICGQVQAKGRTPRGRDQLNLAVGLAQQSDKIN
jgi:hypothetical protein